MKKLILTALVSLLAVACIAQGDNAKMKALYEKNLATIKASIAAFEKEDLEGWASAISDTVKFHSAAYGDNNTTKAHWKESVKYYLDNWDNIKLVNPIFLPGIDPATMQMDGSVRYYGTYEAVHKSGVKTSLNCYFVYEFNKDGKVVDGSDFFDAGGLENAVKPKQ